VRFRLQTVGLLRRRWLFLTHRRARPDRRARRLRRAERRRGRGGAPPPGRDDRADLDPRPRRRRPVAPDATRRGGARERAAAAAPCAAGTPWTAALLGLRSCSNSGRSKSYAAELRTRATQPRASCGRRTRRARRAPARARRRRPSAPDGRRSPRASRVRPLRACPPPRRSRASRVTTPSSSRGPALDQDEVALGELGEVGHRLDPACRRMPAPPPRRRQSLFRTRPEGP
jgi:hypothetical protein